MALDPSEIDHKWHVDYDDNQSELENKRDSSGSVEAEETERTPPESNDSEHVPRWCRKEILPQIEAGTFGASRKR